MRSLAALLVLALAAAAGAAPALAQHSFAWEAHEQGAAAGLLQLTIFHSDVINTGTLTSTYRVAMAVEAPPIWVTSMCEGNFCYAPFVREFDFTLAPGDTNDIGANITPVTDLGGCLATLTVTCLDNPALVQTRSFTVVTPGLDVLIVDADDSADPVPWTAAALGALGKSSVAWTAAAVGSPEEQILANYGTVIWSTGGTANGLDEAARSALSGYVQQGGHLWLNGANLAFSQCSPASPVYSAASLAWMRDVVGADWVAFSANSTLVNGLTGDELGDGLAMTLGGGDSASNNSAPDVLTATAGTACLAYGTGTTAAVRRVWGAGRIVLTAFTLEGVQTAAQRTDLAGAVLGWYVGGASAVGDLPAARLGAPRATPNPFNPRTVLSFELAGTAAQAVSITVHDARGRLVRRLLQTSLQPGPQAVAWDGRDDGGRALAAGVYLARISAGEASAALKMTLAK